MPGELRKDIVLIEEKPVCRMFSELMSFIILRRDDLM